MDQSVFNLPIEIQEKILGMLDADALLAAAEASPTTWKIIAEDRLFRRLCLRHINADLLAEMSDGRITGETDVQVEEDINWGVILDKWTKTIDVDAIRSSSSSEHRPYLMTLLSSSTFVVSGDTVFLGDRLNEIFEYDVTNGRYIVLHYDENGQCPRHVIALGLLNVVTPNDVGCGCGGTHNAANIEVATREHDAMVVVTQDLLIVYAISLPSRWCKIEPIHLTERQLLAKISVQGNQFATYDCADRKFTIRRVSPIDVEEQDHWNVVTIHTVTLKEEQQQLQQQLNNNPQMTPIDFNLWTNYLVVLFENGSMATWNFSSAGGSSLQFRTKGTANIEFRYPVNSFMRRGLTFVDVTSAREMLGYWHMADGSDPYWLVSTDFNAFERLSSLLPNGIEEVSAICVKFTFLVAATNIGNCYLYRHLESDARLLHNLFTRQPLAVIKMTGSQRLAIRSCGLSFGRDYCVLVVFTNDSSLFAVKLPLKRCDKNKDIVTAIVD